MNLLIVEAVKTLKSNCSVSSQIHLYDINFLCKQKQTISRNLLKESLFYNYSPSMEGAPDTISHFPFPLCPHTDQRELFRDYGSPWSVDVRVAANEGRVKFSCQRLPRCPFAGDLTLAARRPTMPLLPPHNCKLPQLCCNSCNNNRS